MSSTAAASRFSEDGYAVFDGALTDYLPVLRAACAGFVAREDARMDAAGVDSIGISHRNLRYFANECQREQPELRRILFSPVMADLLLHATGDNLSPAQRRAYLAQYTGVPMIDASTGRLRRNAIRLLDNGRQVTFA